MMIIINPGERPETVEIHVKITREELGQLYCDMRSDCTSSNPYDVTEDFMNYLKEL